MLKLELCAMGRLAGRQVAEDCHWLPPSPPERAPACPYVLAATGGWSEGNESTRPEWPRTLPLESRLEAGLRPQLCVTCKIDHLGSAPTACDLPPDKDIHTREGSGLPATFRARSETSSESDSTA